MQSHKIQIGKIGCPPDRLTREQCDGRAELGGQVMIAESQVLTSLEVRVRFADYGNGAESKTAATQ